MGIILGSSSGGLDQGPEGSPTRRELADSGGMQFQGCSKENCGHSKEVNAGARASEAGSIWPPLHTESGGPQETGEKAEDPRDKQGWSSPSSILHS